MLIVGGAVVESGFPTQRCLTYRQGLALRRRTGWRSRREKS
ncbi:hypothetical protein [Mesorhizobium sp. B2-8-5]